jgi:site-specific DNA-methyltransferase (adenine-specific)
VLLVDAIQAVEAGLASECDVLITDPPYSEHVHRRATSARTGARGAVPRDLGFEPLTPELREAIATAAGQVRRWSVLFADYEGAGAWMTALAPRAEYVRLVPWVRWSQPQLTGDRPPSGSEAVIHAHAGRRTRTGRVRPIAKSWTGPGSLTAYSRRALRATRDPAAPKHGAEKPLDLMLDLVSWYSAPGETVLDLCAGHGTTLLAAALLGRRGVGCEVAPRYYDRALARLAGPLSDRDRARAAEWVETTASEAAAAPVPCAADGSDVPTWLRAQARLDDAARVAALLEG